VIRLRFLLNILQLFMYGLLQDVDRLCDRPFNF